MAEVDIEYLRSWIGRSETRSDILTDSLIERFQATIPVGLWDGADVPLGLIWCLGLPALPLDQLGNDGHPARGGFLPPVPLRSRMWAGGEIIFMAPLSAGDHVVHRAEIADVTEKNGRTGQLVFVTVNHEYCVDGETRISERQDIVYREPVLPVPVTPAESMRGEGWHVSGPVQLFRYSALTFNGHRIHYDADYARSEEGYPGLVVHGPLQATLLLNRLAAELGRTPRTFSFRGQHPLIAGEAYRVVLGEGEAWCEKAGGTVTMKAAWEA